MIRCSELLNAGEISRTFSQLLSTNSVGIIIRLVLISPSTLHTFMNASDTKRISSTIWEAAMFVLWIGGIDEVCSYKVSGGIRFMTIGLGIQIIFKTSPQQCERLQCWYCWSEGMIHVLIFMTIGSDIQPTLWILRQQFKRLQWWYYWWAGFMMYAIDMASCGMIYV
jgi:hypothetical protein